VKDPAVEVWLPTGWLTGAAEDVTESEERYVYLRQVLVASGFAARAAGINPHTMSEDEFQRVTESYRLIKIRTEEARTGKGGPGELAWIWPLATTFLIAILFFQRKRR
jgi:hypothetical protein